jgi:hypothetical protein
MMKPRPQYLRYGGRCAVLHKVRTVRIGRSLISSAYLPTPPKNLGPSRRHFQEAVCGDRHRCIAWICRLSGLLDGALEKP